MKKQIVRISVLQSSKMAAVLYALIGFIYAAIGALMLVNATQPQQRILGVCFLLAPLWTAALGFIFFALAAAVYNLAAKWIGGFEFEVEEIEDEDDGEANS